MVEVALTIVDATIINAPTSTKNREGERDPEMKQTQKGNQWYFRMKTRIGVDSKTKLIHAVAVSAVSAVSAASVHDKRALPHLLHGGERRVYGDAGYAGQKASIRQHAPQAKDFTQRRGRGYRCLSPEERAKNRTKSRVRAKGRACHRRHQTHLRFCQSSLPWLGQERASLVRYRRPGHSLPGAKLPSCDDSGEVAPDA